ncbi:DUF637 domain-containing protein, partial [Campylobacter sp. 1BO]
SAIIANASVQATNYAISEGKAKFDTDQVAQSALAAGMGAYVSSYINNLDILKDATLANDNSSFLNFSTDNSLNFSYQNFTKAALNSISNAGINSAIYGTNFKDTLISNLAFKATDNLYNAVGSYSVDQSQLNNNQMFNEGSLGKIILHSAVGALSASLTNQDVLTGTLSAGINEAMSSLIYENTSNMSKEQIQEYNSKRLLYSQLTGIAIGALINGEAGANTGYSITTSAELNNRQLHQAEIDFINSKASDYAKINNISKEQATKILYTAAKTLVDKEANDEFNNNENFTVTDEQGNSLTYNLNEIINNYNANDILKAKEYLKQTSTDLKFIDIYKEEFNRQDFFTATSEQYSSSSWTPDGSIGLSDESLLFVPIGKMSGSGIFKGKKCTAGIIGKVNRKIDNNADIKIRFGNNDNQIHHVERHIREKTNLDIEAVKKEILKDFQQQNDKSQLKYNIKIDNYNLEYRVHRLIDETYNIGTIIVK